MSAYSLSKIVGVGMVLALVGCAGGAPQSINNVCAVFAQNDGWMTNWQRSAGRAERKYGIPVPVMMATIRNESGFRHNARPPRKYYLGFIPGKRASSAYGYSQALDGTWAQYLSESGNLGARRSNFDDAVDFVGWFHAKTVATYAVSPSDAYKLSLAYHAGWGAFGQGRSSSTGQAYARATAKTAAGYEGQLRGCR